MNARAIQGILLGLLGAIAGGAIGYYLFFWIAHQGFYAIMLPGWLLGYGAGLCARIRMTSLTVLCVILSLALGFFTEWKFRPFIADESLTYFVTNLHKLQPLTLILIAFGGFLSYRATASRAAANSTPSVVP